MRIAVGSGNPVKRDATARVFPDATVVAESVPSGVAEQPFGHDETRTGAQNRAAAALRERGSCGGAERRCKATGRDTSAARKAIMTELEIKSRNFSTQFQKMFRTSLT